MQCAVVVSVGVVAVSDGRAIVRGCTGGEQTTVETRTDGRPTEAVRRGTVRERTCFEMCLANRTFTGLRPGPLRRCSQLRSPHRKVSCCPITPENGRRQQNGRPWRLALADGMDDAREAFASANKASARHKSVRARHGRLTKSDQDTLHWFDS